MAYLLCLLLHAALAADIAPSAALSGRIALEPWEAAPPTEATLPWVDAGAPDADPFASLADMAPLAAFGGKLGQANGAAAEPALRATVWLGMDKTALYLRVGVIDPEPYNKHTGSNIWDGDSIQVSLDPAPRRAPGLGVDADALPAGALFATFAQTAAGPQAWAHLRGGNKPSGPLKVSQRISRDAALGQTLYEITLPFSELGTTAGVIDQLGFGLQVNGANPKQAAANHIAWGGGPSGTFRPGRLHRLATAPLPPDYVALAVTRAALWQDDDFGQAALVSRADGPLEVEVLWRQQRHRLSLPAPDPQQSTAAAAARRWNLKVWGPPGCGHALPLQVTVTDAKGHVRAHLAQEIACPVRRMDAVRSLLRNRITTPNAHPLERRMRQAQAALLETAWARATTLLPQSPEQLIEVLEAAEVIGRATLNRAAEWHVYSHGGRPLTLTFVAAQDGTLQPYGLRLPKNWTPDKPQPVVVFLHGKGDPRVSQFMADMETHTSLPLDDAYVLLPWGRGIMGYQGLAEADVLEALASAGRQFAFDPERTYLMGFSMGGAGAWNLALHEPEPWAAVAIASGGTWLTALGHHLGGNANGLPLAVWHGDADGTVDVSEAHHMQAEAEASHVALQLHIEHGKGHDFDDAMRHTMADWLLQQRRHRPDPFTYIAEDFTHRGRRGIRLRRDAALAPFPQFTCRTDADNVFIDSEGTTGLDVDLGPLGLGRQGTTTVVWNGQPVYRGPPSNVILGAGAGR